MLQLVTASVVDTKWAIELFEVYSFCASSLRNSGFISLRLVWLLLCKTVLKISVRVFCLTFALCEQSLILSRNDRIEESRLYLILSSITRAITQHKKWSVHIPPRAVKRLTRLLHFRELMPFPGKDNCRNWFSANSASKFECCSSPLIITFNGLRKQWNFLKQIK